MAETFVAAPPTDTPEGMNSDFPSPRIHGQRRAALAKKLSGPALIPSGGAVPRNYQANTFPFRASSHFLYLVGRAIEDAFLLVDGDNVTLFLTPPAADDALWHGPSAGIETLSEELGLSVLPKSRLFSALKKLTKIATLPGPDAATRDRQRGLLRRTPSFDKPTEEDAELFDAMIALRLQHDEAAIGSLERAAIATRDAHLRGMAVTRPGILEAVVCAEMEAAIGRHNMTTAYGSIVTVHGEVLHNHHHHHELRDGDLLLADVGAETEGGWAGDVTRTWPVSGAYSPTQRDVYAAVLNSQLAAIEAVKPGARYRDVHLRAAHVLGEGLVELGILEGDPAELVADGVVALLFPHGVGHLLGLDVHDMEDLGDRAGYAEGRERSEQFGLSYLRLDRDLVPGMAVTIEPGFYQVPAILENEKLTACAKGRLNRERLADFADVRGIRIEDDVLVTQEGNRVLSKAIPKDITWVEGAVGVAS